MPVFRSQWTAKGARCDTGAEAEATFWCDSEVLARKMASEAGIVVESVQPYGEPIRTAATITTPTSGSFTLPTQHPAPPRPIDDPATSFARLALVSALAFKEAVSTFPIPQSQPPRRPRQTRPNRPHPFRTLAKHRHHHPLIQAIKACSSAPVRCRRHRPAAYWTSWGSPSHHRAPRRSDDSSRALH